MSLPVVTRFAPSPTGFLHIGGARTALFNWLYAKKTNGKMLLRIEDTDRKRSTQEAVDALLDGLSWLGLQWDGEAFSQFSRKDRHKEIAEELVKKGKAYYCYTTVEELEAMRNKMEQTGKKFHYQSVWREHSPEDAPLGKKGVIRIKTPQTGETVIEDKVLGTISFPNKDIDDFILLRSDGTPTYMLSVVVDDHDMGVTHIIRGDDHLTNAARQTIIYEAMGWQTPEFAHIPLIHGSDGTKLSKRHGALGVDAYRAMGYLPEALRNYLVRLGWGHGDEEIISDENMKKWFSLEKINKSPSRFDFKKLESINNHYIKQKSDEDLLTLALEFLQYFPEGDKLLHMITKEKKQSLLKAMPILKMRAKTLIELWDSASFLLENRPLTLEDDAKKFITEENLAILKDLLQILEKEQNWDKECLNQILHDYSENKGIKFAKIAQPLRATLAGKISAPSISDLLFILEKEESIARIQDIL